MGALKKNIIPIAFLTACAGLLLWPAIIALGILPARVDAYEKRVPAPFPKQPEDRKSLEKWPRGVDQYLSDNIPHRGYLIGTNAVVKYFGFGSSPTPNVMVGKDGWLFHNIPIVNEEIQGKIVREPYQIRRMRITLEERREWLAENGMEYLVLIAPSKHSIYWDKLPSWIKADLSKATRKTLLLDHLQEAKSDLQVFDFTPSLRQARKKWGDGLYYKFDTHWNYRGAFEAYKDLSKAYPMWFTAPAPNWRGSTELKETNLMQMMGLSRMESSEFVQAPGGFELKRLPQANHSKQQPSRRVPVNIFQNSRGNKKKIFVIGDSFLTWNAPYLAHSFSMAATTNTWNQGWKRYEQFPWREIAAFKPNIVVDQMVENRLDISNLVALLTDPKGKNHPEFIREARIRRLANRSGIQPCEFFQVGTKLEVDIPEQLQGKQAFILKLQIEAEVPCQLKAISPYSKDKAWEDLCIRGAEMTERNLREGQAEIWICASASSDKKTLEFNIKPGTGMLWVKQVEISVHPDV